MKKLLCTAILLSTVFTVFSFADKNNDRNYRYRNTGNTFGYAYSYPVFTISLNGGYSFLNDYYFNTLSYNPYYGGYDNYYYEKYTCDAQKARKKIEKLEAAKDSEENVRKELSKIVILEAKFYKQYTTHSASVSTAEITLDNGSKYAVKRIYFRGNLKTHLTKKLIIDEAFNYDTANTLESSDRATYKIPLNSFGNWSKTRAPDLAVFEVIVEGIETPDGKIIKTGNFTSSDGKLLKKLKKEYGY